MTLDSRQSLESHGYPYTHYVGSRRRWRADKCVGELRMLHPWAKVEVNTLDYDAVPESFLRYHYVHHVTWYCSSLVAVWVR